MNGAIDESMYYLSIKTNLKKCGLFFKELYFS